jgi:hypothetical protein
MKDPLFVKSGHNLNFVLCSRMCNETPGEYAKRRFEEYKRLTTSHPGYLEDRTAMESGVLIWWEGQHIGYFSNQGLVAEKKNPKR